MPFNTTYMKEKVIELVKSADISQYGWFDDIVKPLLKGTYAGGYLDAKVEDLGNSLSSSDEEYRDEILEICDYDIWD